LVYIRKDAEDAEGTTAWEMVRNSLKLDTAEPTKVADPEIDFPSGVYAGGVLNGKAVSLPRPDHPSLAIAAGAVVVAVTIDETGKVISAHAVSGHPSLRAVSEDAARRARFTPTTLCGKAVKVNGSIVYNFAAR
jgi:hypothetical protein